MYLRFHMHRDRTIGSVAEAIAAALGGNKDANVTEKDGEFEIAVGRSRVATVKASHDAGHAPSIECWLPKPEYRDDASTQVLLLVGLGSLAHKYHPMAVLTRTHGLTIEQSQTQREEN